MKELVNEKSDLITKLVKLEVKKLKKNIQIQKKTEEISDPLDDEDRKKRFRRTAS